MKISCLAVMAAGLVVSSAAHADTFNYSYTVSDNGVVYDSFTATSPTLITSTTTLLTSTCTESTYGGYPCYAAIVSPENGYIELFVNVVEGTSNWNRYPTSFFGLGRNTFDDATLDIVDVPSTPVSATPEPGSFALLGTGLLGVMGVVRKRLV